MTFPSTLLRIINSAFKECGLTSLNIPSSVTYIEPGVFNNNQLSDEEAFIYARNSDGSIDYTTLISYGGANRDNIIIPDSVKTISAEAFFMVIL